MDITFFNRDFSKRIQPPGRWTVRKMEWRAEGSCYSAEIELPSGTPDLPALLRAPVEIWDERGGLAWWGFVTGISTPDYSISLDQVANHVAVTYIYEGPDRNLVGTKKLTDWASNADSIALYGTRERIMSIGRANDQLATSKRDVYLAQHGYPHMQPVSPTPSPTLPLNPLSGVKGKGVSRLHCLGWWSTFGWRYYANTAGRHEFTTPVGETNNYYNFGDGLRTVQFGQGIMITDSVAAGWVASSIWLPLRKVGTPGDALLVSFCQNDSLKPGTVIGSAEIDGGQLGITAQWTEFVLMTSPTPIQANTLYWIVVGRSGGTDADNYYQVHVDADIPIPPAGMQTWGPELLVQWNDGNWSSMAGELNYRLRSVASMDDQAAAITTLNPFLTGCRFDQATNQYSDPYRDGFRTALTELRDLLSAGDYAGHRLLASVDPNRILTVRPKSTVVELVGLAGNWLQEMRGYELVGRWTRLKGVDLAPLPGGQDGFIEKVTWTGGVMEATFSW